jgi:hypothetical protein
MMKKVEEMMKRVEANNDAASIRILADSYDNGLHSFQQDQTKAMESYLEYYYLIKALFAENINRQSTQHFDSLQ